jgi:hypothetical protein
VLYLTLELPEYDMKLRICRKKAGVSKYDFQKKNYTENQKQIIDDTWKELEQEQNVYIRSLENKTL